jgi:hypothetical protein
MTNPKPRISFKQEIAIALRNYAENWEIKEIAREYLKNHPAKW